MSWSSGRSTAHLIAALSNRQDDAARQLDQYLCKSTRITPAVWPDPLRVVADVLEGITGVMEAEVSAVTIMGALDHPHLAPLTGLAALALSISDMPAHVVFTLADSVDGGGAIPALYGIMTIGDQDDTAMDMIADILADFDPGDVAALVVIAAKGLYHVGITAARIRQLADKAAARASRD